MNSLTAAELKRRGMAAIEEGLRHGPVHLVKRNKPAAVVLSAKDYARLSLGNGIRRPGMTAVQWLLNQPTRGAKRKEQLDKSLRAERDDWA
jgi:prevent-host-death family protein